MKKLIQGVVARFWLVLAFATNAIQYAIAQDINSGRAGLETATQTIKGYFSVVRTLIYVIGAIIGLIGAIKVYTKFSNGDPDVGKTAASWFGACIFLIVAGTVLGAFFNVS